MIAISPAAPLATADPAPLAGTKIVVEARVIVPNCEEPINPSATSGLGQDLDGAAGGSHRGRTVRAGGAGDLAKGGLLDLVARRGIGLDLVSIDGLGLQRPVGHGAVLDLVAVNLDRRLTGAPMEMTRPAARSPGTAIVVAGAGSGSRVRQRMWKRAWRLLGRFRGEPPLYARTLGYTMTPTGYGA